MKDLPGYSHSVEEIFNLIFIFTTTAWNVNCFCNITVLEKHLQLPKARAPLFQELLVHKVWNKTYPKGQNTKTTNRKGTEI